MYSDILQKTKNRLKPLQAKILSIPQVKRVMELLGFQNYDLPLHKDDDGRFLVTLIALMSFLAVLATSGSLALSNMTNHWSSGLENKITIEVTGQIADGSFLSPDTITSETQKVAKGLKNTPFAEEITILSGDDIRDIISPWIQKDLPLEGITLPGLISIELKKSNAKILNNLRADVKKLSDYAEVRTHHEWLSGLLSFTKTLNFVARVIVLIIIAITILSITTAIRTRLAIHRKEVELLHNMGATDIYIARQFQRHALLFSLQGSAIGTVLGLIFVSIVLFLTAGSEISFLPALTIGGLGFSVLLFVPALISTISTITSRFTVLRSLTKMP